MSCVFRADRLAYIAGKRSPDNYERERECQEPSSHLGQYNESASALLAKAKSQEKVSDVTNDVADACSNCHEVYRDKGPFGSPARCTP
jgi:cytochrome c556